MDSLENAGYRSAYEPRARVYWELRPTLWSTFKRFVIYSRNNIRAGLFRQWQSTILFRYGVLAVLLIAALRIPKVVRTEEESARTLSMYRHLLRNPFVWLYSLAIIAYVGCEQGTADWMSPFLERYHQVDPHKGGADAVAYYWGLMTAGCLLGMGLLKLFDSRRVLIGFALGALCMLSLALFGPADVSRVAFPCIGFFASIMWPTLVSLGLNSVPQHHGPFAGILCSGIMGGALVPLVIGWLGGFLDKMSGVTFWLLHAGLAGGAAAILLVVRSPVGRLLDPGSAEIEETGLLAPA